MRAVDAYPHDVVMGTCFVTGRYEVEPGERVLDLDIDMDALPPYGRLCLSELAVRTMCTELGWKIMTPEWEAEYEAATEALSDAVCQLDELMDAMAGMLNLAGVQKALDVAARRIAGKESIEEWIGSLEGAK